MDNQHRKISGYRELTEAEIELINQIKALGASLHGMLDALTQVKNIDQRWLSIARTDLQTGTMAAVRSVARPDSF